MPTNLDRYKQDLDLLIKSGEQLHLAMQLECSPAVATAFKKQLGGDEAEALMKNLPSFSDSYQAWYSEAGALIKQLLPDRYADFVRHYEKPKPRKDISYENYRIEDYLQGLQVTRAYNKEKVVGPDAAIPHFKQQQSIFRSHQEALRELPFRHSPASTSGSVRFRA